LDWLIDWFNSLKLRYNVFMFDRGLAAANDINDEQGEVGTIHGVDVINRILQLSNGRQTRHKPETEVGEIPLSGMWVLNK